MLPMAIAKPCVALKLNPARWGKILNGFVRDFSSSPHTATSCNNYCFS